MQTYKDDNLPCTDVYVEQPFPEKDKLIIDADYYYISSDSVAVLRAFSLTQQRVLFYVVNKSSVPSVIHKQYYYLDSSQPDDKLIAPIEGDTPSLYEQYILCVHRRRPIIKHDIIYMQLCLHDVKEILEHNSNPRTVWALKPEYHSIPNPADLKEDINPTEIEPAKQEEIIIAKQKLQICPACNYHKLKSDETICVMCYNHRQNVIFAHKRLFG